MPLEEEVSAREKLQEAISMLGAISLEVARDNDYMPSRREDHIDRVIVKLVEVRNEIDELELATGGCAWCGKYHNITECPYLEAVRCPQCEGYDYAGVHHALGCPYGS